MSRQESQLLMFCRRQVDHCEHLLIFPSHASVEIDISLLEEEIDSTPFPVD